MIIDYDFKNPAFQFEKADKSELCIELARLQREVKNLDIPVLIMVDGWESSGKGHVIKELTRELDPRTFEVNVFRDPSKEEASRPFLWRFLDKIPPRGNMVVFERSFYYSDMNNLKAVSKDLRKDMIEIGRIEEDLYNDEMIVLKFFLHIKEKTQRKRIEELLSDKNRSFLVTDRDKIQNKNYEAYLGHFDRILRLSDFSFSPWHVVSAQDKDAASREVMGTAIGAIKEGIERIVRHRADQSAYERRYEPEQKPLDKISLNQAVQEEEYEKRLEKLQKEASELLYELYTKKIPCVVVFEGMDAAGKGGAVKRLTRMMDPRSYKVIPISAPNEMERQYHYLWRFNKRLPRLGNLAIFDRSWYGRVLVERIEGYTSVRRWDAAYEEINGFEKQMHHAGAIVQKFFLYIDKEEQLKRFTERQIAADKMYKITEEDWRNREKWDSYLEAMNEMLVRTDTDHAPWIILSGQDKKYARIRVLEEFIRNTREQIDRRER
ncbi:hypothetical protein [Parasporobacterium paucivorans]|uniref:Polyphosphate:AMP phosphotransferase n=1 Tax=Parasporobacterium paucivorans DSM 15970 TaxID=1122934 RepID=A0A1M6E808_9FIRM|nr:hypothetical protein [Parasporobacterium paucivorans]SHI81543.1 polyphosphate:AMP phosphotransferase [Parasporobacterium paucivorans DSM 15970]